MILISVLYSMDLKTTKNRSLQEASTSEFGNRYQKTGWFSIGRVNYTRTTPPTESIAVPVYTT